MTDHGIVTVVGCVTDIFAHRFVVATSTGERILADLGPEGIEAFPLGQGLAIELRGEQKPSELKISSIARSGETPVVIARKKKQHSETIEPGTALRVAEAAGFQPIGDARRKPKHFEILGRREGAFFECHVTFEGTIRKEKPVDADDEKWSSAIKAVA